MTFDPQSMKRLRELGRQLPKILPKPTINKEGQAPRREKHPIEAEEDPSLLFKELIQASKDGKVPRHLITRLKEIEEKQIKQMAPNTNKENNNNRNHRNSVISKSKSSEQVPKESLYTTFDRLLFNEED